MLCLQRARDSAQSTAKTYVAVTGGELFFSNHSTKQVVVVLMWHFLLLQVYTVSDKASDVVTHFISGAVDLLLKHLLGYPVSHLC